MTLLHQLLKIDAERLRALADVLYAPDDARSDVALWRDPRVCGDANLLRSFLRALADDLEVEPSAMTRCAFCDEPVSTRGLREVIGWEKLRVAGGLHGLISRHETGRWCCVKCRQKLEHGVTPGQMGLEL